MYRSVLEVGARSKWCWDQGVIENVLIFLVYFSQMYCIIWIWFKDIDGFYW
jgi:hypothetical protein